MNAVFIDDVQQHTWERRYPNTNIEWATTFTISIWVTYFPAYTKCTSLLIFLHYTLIINLPGASLARFLIIDNFPFFLNFPRINLYDQVQDNGWGYLWIHMPKRISIRWSVAA